MKQEFTAQKRKEIKRDCKSRVLNNLGRCVGIQVLYAVPFVLMFAIVYLSLFGRMFAMIMAGYTNEYMLGMALAKGMNSFWVLIFLMIAINGPLSLGMIRFYRGLQRGEELGISTLFKPFTSLRSAWAGIKMQFCLSFRAMLWMIVPFIVYIFLLFALTFGAAVSGNINSAKVLLIILYVVYVIALVLIQIKLMTYSAGWVILCDDETHGVWDATRKASAVFKGQLGKLFVFVLSFIGWYILLMGAVYLCIGLGIAGLILVQGVTGIAILVAACIAGVCVWVLLGVFLYAYELTSFFGMYEYLSAPATPVTEPQETFFNDSWPGQGGDGTPQ